MKKNVSKKTKVFKKTKVKKPTPKKVATNPLKAVKGHIEVIGYAGRTLEKTFKNQIWVGRGHNTPKISPVKVTIEAEITDYLGKVSEGRGFALRIKQVKQAKAATK